MAIEQLNIVQKEDSADKLAQMQGVPEKNYVKASEFNQVKDKVNEVVSAANQKKESLNDTHNEFPSSKAVRDETEKKITKAEKDELEVLSAVDVNDVDPKGKGLLFFKNAITVTGIKSVGLYEGQEFFIMNGSIGVLTIANMSNSSTPGNRIYLQSGQNLSMKPNGVIRLRYSKVRSRFEVITSFGVDMLASLAYAGNVQRVVTVTPEGVCFAEEMMEYEVFDETTVGYANLNAIVLAYPSSAGRKKGFQVICPYTTPPCIFKKCSDGDEKWIKLSAVTL
jgi:hypothetical protein